MSEPQIKLQTPVQLPWKLPCSWPELFDQGEYFDKPQFFSLIVDYATASVNVHRLSKNVKSGSFCFHMKHPLRYILDIDGLRAVNLAVKNILDYGVNERLQKICGELNIYTQKSVQEMDIFHQR